MMRVLKINEFLDNKVKCDVKVNDKIHIVKMEGETGYDGKEGIVQHIDSLGQLHGTWGGCAVIPGIDDFYVI